MHPRLAADLVLYASPICPYCVLVRRELVAAGVTIEERDVRLDAVARDELVAATGLSTVPVLRIRQGDGFDRWMPESRDIVRYLRERFGKPVT